MTRFVCAALWTTLLALVTSCGTPPAAAPPAASVAPPAPEPAPSVPLITEPPIWMQSADVSADCDRNLAAAKG